MATYHAGNRVKILDATSMPKPYPGLAGRWAVWAPAPGTDYWVRPDDIIARRCYDTYKGTRLPKMQGCLRVPARRLAPWAGYNDDGTVK